jgi:hypothetical protein
MERGWEDDSQRSIPINSGSLPNTTYEFHDYFEGHLIAFVIYACLHTIASESYNLEYLARRWCRKQNAYSTHSLVVMNWTEQFVSMSWAIILS